MVMTSDLHNIVNEVDNVVHSDVGMDLGLTEM
jgi:hypothetical protein